MVQALPRILDWGEFNEVGFYDFLKLQECLFKAMGKNLNLTAELFPEAPTRALLVGKFHHKLSELVYKCQSKDELNKKIEEEIIAVQALVLAWPQLKFGSVSGWDEINFFAISALKNFQRKTGIKNNARLGSEEQLVSKERLFLGRPDFFTVIEREAELRELKTGSLTSEVAGARTEYEQQILFYAVLLFDNFDIDVVHANLISPRSEQIERHILKADAAIQRASIVSLIKDANLRLNGSKRIEDLASPSKENCKNCNKRAICRRFIASEFDFEFERDIYVLDGMVDGISEAPNSPTASLRISDQTTPRSVQMDIPIRTARELEEKRRYIFTDLKHSLGNFHWAQNSGVYAYD